MLNTHKVSHIYNLYDDASVHEKLTIMNKIEVLTDDGRNDPNGEFADAIDNLLKPGYAYRVTFEEVGLIDA